MKLLLLLLLLWATTAPVAARQYTLELQLVRPHNAPAFIAPGKPFGVWLQSPYPIWDIEAEGFTFTRRHEEMTKYGLILHLDAVATAPHLALAFTGWEGPRRYTLQEAPQLLLPLIQQGVPNDRSYNDARHR